VKIAFGTDVGGFDWKIDAAVEFPYMVKYGMTPAQAIQAATRNAADLLDMSGEVGSIQPGKFADIVATSGNPLEDVAALQKIDFVMKNGMVYKDARIRP
jgi:imidazolonepropionase-like amidohydrolase